MPYYFEQIDSSSAKPILARKSAALADAVLRVVKKSQYHQFVPNDGPKYKQIWQSLKSAIESGTYAPGVRLPSEFELVQTYGASRVTVSRALKELQLGGYIDRRAGSGTYVRASNKLHHTFGLIIPELGQTEIFEPICQGMTEAQKEQNHVLIWGR